MTEQFHGTVPGAGFNNSILGGQSALIRPAIKSPNYVPGVSGWSINKDGSAEFNSIVVPPGTGGGATIFVQGPTPVAHAVGDLWYDNTNGMLLHQWNGSTWAPYTIGTGAITPGSITAALIAANTITAAQIAANTITATQLAAGIIYAGIVDATTINAATFQGTNFVINSSGIFFYNGTPGAGKLILAIAPANASDPFGNSYVQGLQVTDPATLLFPSNRPVEQSAAIINSAVANQGAVNEFLQLLISGPACNTVGARDLVFTEYNSASKDNSSNANLEFIYQGSNGTQHLYAYLDASGFTIQAGNVTAPHPGSNPAVGETWQTTAVGNGWTGGPLNFKKTPDNCVRLWANLTTPGSAVNGTIATLPVGYRPFNPQPFNGTHALAASFNERWTLNSNGTLVSAGFGASQQAILDKTVPLDL